jgi:dipeptidyl aminopeptidase/acylaminoacyl peptidase
MTKFSLTSALIALSCCVLSAVAQGEKEDYKRAFDAPKTFSWEKVTGTVSEVSWTENSENFYYRTRTSVGAPTVYRIVNVASGETTTCDSLRNVRKTLGIPEPEAPRGPQPPEKHWMVTDPEDEGEPCKSPDGTQEAFIKNYNIYVRDIASGQERQLTCDGGMGFYYSVYMTWSPDGSRIAASKLRRAQKHYVSFVESSPKDQLQPKLHTMEYCKPGDDLDYREPRVVDVATDKTYAPATDLFSHQYELMYPYWLGDNNDKIYFEYNERGHKVYRLLEYSVKTNTVRTVVKETSPKYVNYTRLWHQPIANGTKMLWSSERDNYNHLYLIDIATGKIERQVTKGKWYVRQVLNVDEENNVIYFTANGRNANEDPYHIHYYRINLDGSNLIDLTTDNGNHSASFSPNFKWLVDTYSTATNAPVTVLRDASTGKVIKELERADISTLIATGWQAPEIFTAPGRDGKTMMWGIIQRPSNFDPNKTYPIIEYIYSGPGDAYVPKSFTPYNWTTTSLSELGFIVVQLDAMGTSFRTKEFEEVCYKNLKDAGFPDRMAWIKAAARKYPYMDIDRMGIYGCSAGGQESTAAVLQYPEFYKAAYSACGCHDNRMDKIWWNEQWMSYPIDESYVECSNTKMASKLSRPLMLVVGEMDDNVDPASTMQLANALINAGKDFELIVLPGERHTMGGAFGEHKRYDFFVKNLMHKFPPLWDEVK